MDKLEKTTSAVEKTTKNYEQTAGKSLVKLTEILKQEKKKKKQKK